MCLFPGKAGIASPSFSELGTAQPMPRGGVGGSGSGGGGGGGGVIIRKIWHNIQSILYTLCFVVVNMLFIMHS